jgi:GAF domain-containing protein
MPKKIRSLTVDDVGSIVTLTGAQADRQVIYKAVEAITAETCGFVFLTTLKYNEAEQVVERLHSSNVETYPVGGRKPLSKIAASHQAMDSGEVFLAGTRAAVKEAFFDHELIFSLGSTAIMNAPIRYGGRRLGTLNLCGEEGMYGPAEIRTAQILAGLLIPSVLQEVGA